MFVCKRKSVAKKRKEKDKYSILISMLYDKPDFIPFFCHHFRHYRFEALNPTISSAKFTLAHFADERVPER
jgi:hypothetical protein